MIRLLQNTSQIIYTLQKKNKYGLQVFFFMLGQKNTNHYDCQDSNRNSLTLTCCFYHHYYQNRGFFSSFLLASVFVRIWYDQPERHGERSNCYNIDCIGSLEGFQFDSSCWVKPNIFIVDADSIDYTNCSINDNYIQEMMLSQVIVCIDNEDVYRIIETRVVSVKDLRERFISLQVCL
jgi:hypothetical protein